MTARYQHTQPRSHDIGAGTHLEVTPAFLLCTSTNSARRACLLPPHQHWQSAGQLQQQHNFETTSAIPAHHHQHAQQHLGQPSAAGAHTPLLTLLADLHFNKCVVLQLVVLSVRSCSDQADSLLTLPLSFPQSLSHSLTLSSLPLCSVSLSLSPPCQSATLHSVSVSLSLCLSVSLYVSLSPSLPLSHSVSLRLCLSLSPSLSVRNTSPHPSLLRHRVHACLLLLLPLLLAPLLCFIVFLLLLLPLLLAPLLCFIVFLLLLLPLLLAPLLCFIVLCNEQVRQAVFQRHHPLAGRRLGAKIAPSSWLFEPRHHHCGGPKRRRQQHTAGASHLQQHRRRCVTVLQVAAAVARLGAE
jgi:hypothetical protein